MILLISIIREENNAVRRVIALLRYTSQKEKKTLHSVQEKPTNNTDCYQREKEIIYYLHIREKEKQNVMLEHVALFVMLAYIIAALFECWFKIILQKIADT